MEADWALLWTSVLLSLTFLSRILGCRRAVSFLSVRAPQLVASLSMGSAKLFPTVAVLFPLFWGLFVSQASSSGLSAFEASINCLTRCMPLLSSD